MTDYDQTSAIEAERQRFYANEAETMARLRREYNADPQAFVLLHLGIGENQAPFPTFGQGMPQSMQEAKFAFRVAQEGVKELFAARASMETELAALRGAAAGAGEEVKAPPKVVNVYPEGAPEGRIEGIFTKQVWGGRKGDDAITLEEVAFDATASVLALSLESIHALEDNYDNSDNIGREHVDHDGPCEVEVADAVCEFFDVATLDEITQSMLDEKRSAYGVDPAEPEGMKP